MLYQRRGMKENVEDGESSSNSSSNSNNDSDSNIHNRQRSAKKNGITKILDNILILVGLTLIVNITLNNVSNAFGSDDIDVDADVLATATATVPRATLEEPNSDNNAELATETNQDKVKQQDNNEQNQNMCSVYLAPSSVPGGGMGMFTVKNVKRGGMILPADGPSIPIIDPDRSTKSEETWTGLFSGYWWESGITDPGLFEADHVAEYQITCGALPNSHPYLNNLDIAHPDIVPYDDSIMDRMTNPGAGAISYYEGRHTMADTDMEAGDEIFLEYPEDYMDYICEKYDIPNRGHYEEAGRIVSILHRKYGNLFSDWENNDVFTLASEKAKKLLPKSQNDLERVLSAARNPNNPHHAAHAIAKEMSIEKRSVEWIREHGICLDSVIPGDSINPRAGKGVIAQRPIDEGDIVAPASLLQITNRDALRMPAFEGKEWQLLLNYCIGRDDSSLLLCPNTNAILFNHCSDRRPEHPCGKENKPNAKYQWAKWDEATDEWLNMTIGEMEEKGGRGLSLEIVATRDIEEGEEVFVDYGVSWESAWAQHVDNWEPPVYENQEWTSAKKLNEELGPLKIAPSLGAKHVISDSREVLLTGCFYYEDDTDFWTDFSDSDDSWRQMTLDEVVDKYGRDYGNEYEVIEDETYSDGSFWPCVIIDNDDSSSEEVTYTVRIIQPTFQEETVWEEKKLPRIISNYPRSSIRHFYVPYKSDIHLPGAFRHHIELPSELFPTIWKDRE
jgi:hypothetical protein